MIFTEYFGNGITAIDTGREATPGLEALKKGYVYGGDGVFGLLPLGLGVSRKIEQIVRDEFDQAAVEMSMPLLTPSSLWEASGRRVTMDNLLMPAPANNQPNNRASGKHVLAPTHEEPITDLARQLFIRSESDLPKAYYQIGQKFRNELRPRGGLIRTKVFNMADLYSFHGSVEELMEYYEQMKGSFLNIFSRLGLGNDTVIAAASGGDYTSEHSHEFQTLWDGGEDTIYLNKATGQWENKEIVSNPHDGMHEPGRRSVEVGNIFPLGTKFSNALGLFYIGRDGAKHPVHMGCYGVGITRALGVVAEMYANKRGGIDWPTSLAPFEVMLTGMYLDEDPSAMERSHAIHDVLVSAGHTVMFDNRLDANPRRKRLDADIIGSPVRVAITPRDLDRGVVRVTNVKTGEEYEIVDISQISKLLANVRDI